MRVILLLLTSLFVISLNAQQWEWTRRINGPANDYVSDVHYDDDGNLYITGRSKFDVIFEDETAPIMPVYYGHTDAFIAKYDTDGNLIWANSAGGPEPDWGWGVTTDLAGNVYYTGETSDTAVFGLDTVISDGIRDIFIAKLDVNGNYEWVRTISTTDEDKGKDIEIDENGDLYVTGFINDTVTIAGTLIGTPNVRNGFIVKMNSDGDFLLAQDISPKLSAGYHLKSDKNGSLYLTGELLYDSYVTDYLLTGPTTQVWRDAFLAKMDYNLSTQWVELVKGPFHNIGESIGLSDNYVYMVGCYSYTCDFSGISLTYNGDGTNTTTFNSSRDMFISKYDFDGNIKWAKGMGGKDYDYAYGIDVTEDDDIYIVGSFEDTVQFDSFEMVSNGGYDIFISKLDSLGNVQWVKQQGNYDNEFGFAIQIDEYENVYPAGGYRGGGQNFDTIWMPIQEYTGYVGKIAQHTDPNTDIFEPNTCGNDTVTVTVNAITSPLSYEFNLTPSGGWIDSNVYSFVYTGTDLSGEIIVSNNIYSDTIQVNELIDISVPIVFDLGQDITSCDFNTVDLSAPSDQNGYLWSTTETTETITVNTTGEYWVTVLDTVGCEVTDSISVAFIDCTGISEIEDQISIVYFQNKIIQLSHDLPNLTWQLFDISGKLIMTESNSTQIGVHDLNSGTYILRFIGVSDEPFKFVVYR